MHSRVIYHAEYNTINTRRRPESDIRRESLPKYYKKLNQKLSELWMFLIVPRIQYGLQHT